MKQCPHSPSLNNPKKQSSSSLWPDKRSRASWKDLGAIKWHLFGKTQKQLLTNSSTFIPFSHKNLQNSVFFTVNKISLEISPLWQSYFIHIPRNISCSTWDLGSKLPADSQSILFQSVIHFSLSNTRKTQTLQAWSKTAVFPILLLPEMQQEKPARVIPAAAGSTAGENKQP